MACAILIAGLTGFSASPADDWKTAPDLSSEVPEPMREFRGFWLTTVYNLDWPSKPGLPVDVQKVELTEILDRAVKLNLNAVVMQVRTMCDAFYDSPIEPWSYYLTGELGKAPDPFYDPLEFAISEAHARGLELHAWFNPFRATTALYGENVPDHHVSRQYPWLLRKDGTHNWLDPSSEFVRTRALTVIFDVVNRYDVDAVHYDDYFYPYPRKGQPPGLDDSENWRRYRISHGIFEMPPLSTDTEGEELPPVDDGASADSELANWRRAIMNDFVRDVYAEVKRAKPWVKVGISPFGIWRPKHPEGINGLDAWRLIYTDTRKWLKEGWVDYLSPQLYWKRGGAQSFTKLYSWWQEQNTRGRHLWPGIAASRIGKRGRGEADGRNAMEVLEQISYTRTDLGEAPASGQLLWRWEAFATSRGGISQLITRKRYAQRAIPPPSPWLAGQGDERNRAEIPAPGDLEIRKETVKELIPPDKPEGKPTEKDKDIWRFTWNAGGDISELRWWVIQARPRTESSKEEEKDEDEDEDEGDESVLWSTERMLPPGTRQFEIELDDLEKIDALSVRGLSRIGELGPATVLERTDSG